jgi:uncharacterized protein YggE
MARVGDAVAMATDAGANVLSGPDLRVSDREASSRSAYAAAYRSARARADTYAGAAGLKVARVLAIYDGGQGFTPSPRYGGRTSMEAMGVQTVAPPPPEQGAPFSAGINTTEVQVRVDFALAPHNPARTNKDSRRRRNGLRTGTCIPATCRCP